MRDGWVETNILDVVEVLDRFRKPINATERESRQGSIPYYGANGQAGWIDDFLFDEELVLLGEDAIDFADPSARKAYLIDGPSWVNNHAHVLRAKQDKVQSYFLAESLNRVDFSQYVSFGTRSKLTQASMNGIKVIVPPLSEQKRIVDLVSSVDSYLGSLRTALAKSVSARKSALENQLQSFNETSPIYRLEELCASGKSAIVDGPFGANLKREDYIEEGIPVLKIQNIKQDFVVIKKMDYVSEGKYQELRRHSFQKNDIVMTKLGDPLGLSAIVRDLDRGLIVADLVRIRPDKIDVEFLCIQLNSAKIQNYINRMQKGSTRPRVNLGMIREMPIAVPSENEIKEFISVFGAWSEQNSKLEESIHSTEQLRSGLLSDLLSGSHEIPASYDKVMGAA
jgi:type I restriction enzyme, S subunit